MFDNPRVHQLYSEQREYRLRVHGIPLRWISRIERWEPGWAFEDVQVKGPYRLWRHRHEFSSGRETRTFAFGSRVATC